MEAVEEGKQGQGLKKINQPGWRLRTSLDFTIRPADHASLREDSTAQSDGKDRGGQAVVDFPFVRFHDLFFVVSLVAAILQHFFIVKNLSHFPWGLGPIWAAGRTP